MLRGPFEREIQGQLLRIVSYLDLVAGTNRTADVPDDRQVDVKRAVAATFARD
jgi:hypothetical protein